MSLKILDYGIPNPFGESIGGRRNLAWPVDAYRVTLPKVSGGEGPNPFERVILTMIDAGGAREAEALASETCLPVDLVQCVLLRLRDKAFIDGHNEIVEQKRDNWENKQDRIPDFVTALFFRELATGKVLPFYHQIDDDNPLKIRERVEKCEKIYWDDDHKNRPPIPRDIISALRATKKRSMAFSGETRLPTVQQITIARDPEKYYLDCPIAIQKSDGEFRIADPFGNGFSLILENSFGRLLEQDDSLKDWLMDWKQNLSNPRLQKKDATHKEPYDNEANQGLYQNLVSNLRLGKNTQHRSIEKIHAALEWALFYTCTQRPFDNSVKQLRLTNQAEHPVLLKQAAEEVGLNLPKYEFRPTLLGKLDGFLSGKAEMETVISISLLMAKTDDEHPLRQVATRHQDFLIRLFDIKKKRDEKRHGKGKAQKNEVELPEEPFMREVVTALLPAIRFSDTPFAEADKDADADSMLDARTSIQNEFGFRLFNQFGPNLQHRLIYAERFWLSCQDGDDALAFACDLYAALQSVFAISLSAHSPEIRDSEFVAEAAENAASAGLEVLPDALCTVRPALVQKAMQGEDHSLGACVLAFLLVSDAEILRSIAEVQPNFISDVADIINGSGHGNKPLPSSKGVIGKLRKSTYSTIKTLSEI